MLVIDVGLPDTDGRDVCQALRAQGIQTPVLFLTARDALADRIAGFDAGGDDYLAKPFAFVELVARLAALLRRSCTDVAIEAGGLRLDPVEHAVADAAARGRADTDRVPVARASDVAARARRCGGASSCGPAGRTARSFATTRSTPMSRDCGASSSAGRSTRDRTVHGVGYRIG